MRTYKILLIGILSIGISFQMKGQELELPELDNLADISHISDLSTSAELSDLLASNLSSGTQIRQLKTQKSNPNRTEEHSFNNVSKVNISQNGGNIIIKESLSKKVEVIIQYFNSGMKKATCNIFMKNGELNIETTGSSKGGAYYINYTISIPKNIPVETNLKYGNISVDKTQATYNLNLSYANAAIGESGQASPDVTIKYGSLKIGNAKDVKIDAMYSKITIEDINVLKLSGMYNSFALKKINSIQFDKQSMYNKYQIGSINNLTANIKYDKIDLGELIQDIDLKCSYSKIDIGTIYPKAKNVKIDGAYSTINMSLDQSISASINVDIKFGDLFISKKYNTKIISDNSDSFNVSKKVQVGNGTPSLSIEVSNSYSNVNIK